VTSGGTVHRLNKAGTELKSWRITNPTNQGIHILENGNVVFTQQHNNRVYEYDPNGKQVWTATVTQPVCVYRLPNGNTMVGCWNPFQLVELNRAGKEVRKASLSIQPYRILYR
jgi:hypothetical protein